LTDRRDYSFINLFTGLVKCSRCGGGFKISNQSGGERKHKHIRYISCYRNKNSGGCERYWIRLDRLENSFFNILNRLDIMEQVINKEEEPITSNLPYLEKQLEHCLTERQRLYDIIKKLDEPPHDIHVELKKSVDKEKDLTYQIEKEKERLLGAVPVKRALEDYKSKFMNRVQDVNFRTELRQLLQDIVDKIVIYITEDKKRSYKLYLKNITEPIEVVLKRNTCEINGVELPYQM
jgi:hypothetical protein